MELPECLLRRLIICDGQAVPADPSRPQSVDECYCRQLREAVDGDQGASHVRWLRARAVARSAQLQRVMVYRQKARDAGADW